MYAASLWQMSPVYPAHRWVYVRCEVWWCVPAETSSIGPEPSTMLQQTTSMKNIASPAQDKSTSMSIMVMSYELELTPWRPALLSFAERLLGSLCRSLLLKGKIFFFWSGVESQLDKCEWKVLAISRISSWYVLHVCHSLPSSADYTFHGYFMEILTANAVGTL